MERKDAVLDVIAMVSETDPGEIRPEMDLVVDLGIDSPNALRLLVELEERLGIEITDDEAARMSTVADVLDHVAARS